MKTFLIGSLIFTVMLLALAAYGEDSRHHHDRVLYRVTNLDSLGGGSSAGNSINNRSWVAGFSSVSDESAVKAALWRDLTPQDLGTLGGLNSAVLWPVKNERGMISGVAETDTDNPLLEAWSCSAFFPTVTRKICQGFVWKDNVMSPLPPLPGGYNSFATGTNNRGQTVGWAENGVVDSSCTAPQVLQFRAVVWEHNGESITDLPPFSGDSTSAATAINDRGQVVGISGICGSSVGRFSATHAMLWYRGTATNLGTLGGIAWDTPMAINSHGDVVGFCNTSAADAGLFRAHAFLWTEEEGMQDLHTLPGLGHTLSQGLGINKRGQIVGMSCAPGFADCRAFLIDDDGVMQDLNDLVVPGYTGHLIFANDINDRGEITGAAFDPATGDTVAFRAVPTHGGHDDFAGRIQKKQVVLPEKVKHLILQRVGLAGADIEN